MANQLVGPYAPPTRAESLGRQDTHQAITSAVHDPLAGTREDATPYDGDTRALWDPTRRQPVGSVHPGTKTAPTNLRTGVNVQSGAVRNILGERLPGGEDPWSPNDPGTARNMNAHLRGVDGGSRGVDAGLRGVLRRAGLNPNFPVTSESADRYKGEPLSQRASPFQVNAPPALPTGGRPILTQNWRIPVTEVKDRFKWPSGADVDKIPWIKNLG